PSPCCCPPRAASRTARRPSRWVRGPWARRYLLIALATAYPRRPRGNGRKPSELPRVGHLGTHPRPEALDVGVIADGDRAVAHHAGVELEREAPLPVGLDRAHQRRAAPGDQP